jgi:hypothetical protein
MGYVAYNLIVGEQIIKRSAAALCVALALFATCSHARTPTKLDQRVCADYGGLAQRVLDLERAAHAGQTDQQQYSQLRRPILQEASQPPYSHLFMQALGSYIETPPWVTDVRAQYESHCLQQVEGDMMGYWPGDAEKPALPLCVGANLPAACFKDNPEQHVTAPPAPITPPVTAPPDTDTFIGFGPWPRFQPVHFKRHAFMCFGGILAAMERPDRRPLQTCVTATSIKADAYQLHFPGGQTADIRVTYRTMRAEPNEPESQAVTAAPASPATNGN